MELISQVEIKYLIENNNTGIEFEYAIFYLLNNEQSKKIFLEEKRNLKTNLSENNKKIISLEEEIQQLKKDDALNDKYSITYFGFGNDIQILDSLNFNESQTDLSLLPVVLFDDVLSVFIYYKYTGNKNRLSLIYFQYLIR